MIGAILAGGSASRFGGGDKGMRLVAGRPILARIACTLRPQCTEVVLNANGDPERLASFGLRIVPDGPAAVHGPLAGLLAVLDDAADRHPECRFALTVPTDAPFLPPDLIGRLQDALVADRAMIACAKSAGRVHHATAIWSIDLRNDLRRLLLGEGERKVGAFVARHPFTTVDWPVTPFDPFLNVNAADDLDEAERVAALADRR